MNHPWLHDALIMIIIFILAGIPTYCVSLCILIPESPSAAGEHAEEHIEYPTQRLTLYGETIDLGFSDEDYRRSMNTPVMRTPTLFIPVPLNFVTPEHPVIQRIAQLILEHTEGMPDSLRVDRALNFVQSTIDYEYDSDLYGQDDFWAYPIECLYLGKGDCEDTSILFASIVLAMGYDCVFLSYPHHYAIGVALDECDGNFYEHDGKKYYFCETTSRWKIGTGSYGYHDDVCIVPMGDIPLWATGLNTLSAYVRNGIYHILHI